MPRDDEFELYDLTVIVEAIEGTCTCAMTVGDRFFLHGGKLSLPDGAAFCLYALQAVIPLLPAKQRPSHPADWMETDTRAACPDPACRLVMRIDRTGRRTLRHDEVSPISWQPAPPAGSVTVICRLDSERQKLFSAVQLPFVSHWL